MDPSTPVFGLSASQISRRVNAAAGVELPALMTAGRWKSSRMPARYTERQAVGRGAVARYY